MNDPASAPTMLDPGDLLAIGDRLVDRAVPGERIEVVLGWSRDHEVRAYDGGIESFSSATAAGFGVRVVRDHRVGVSWAGTLDEDALEEVLAEARDNATFAEPDEHAGPAEPDGVPVAPLDLFDPSVLTHPTEEKLSLALELERLVRAGDPRMVGVESADYADSISIGAVVTSTGIRTASVESSCSLVVYALAGDGDEVTEGFGFSVGRSPAELNLQAAADDAVERAVRLLGAGRPTTGRMTVVLDPWVTAQLLGIIGETLSGEAVLKGRSPFAGRVGEAVASPLLTLLDDPTDPRSPTATVTDAEGLATRPVRLIDDGVLAGFLHNSQTARALGTVSTGSAVRHGFGGNPTAGPMSLRLLPGRRSRAEVLAEVGDGILVQEVSGLHSGVNPVSGDFSTGAEGVVLRGGEPAGAVREFTIASTLQRMLTEVVAVADDLTYLPMESAGLTLAVADVTVSGD